MSSWLESLRKVIRMEFSEGTLSSSGAYPSHTMVTSPLTRDSRSLSASMEQGGSPRGHTPSPPRPLSGEHSLNYSFRKDSFSTVSSDSRPSSLREASPFVHDGSPGPEGSVGGEEGKS